MRSNLAISSKSSSVLLANGLEFEMRFSTRGRRVRSSESEINGVLAPALSDRGGAAEGGSCVESPLRDNLLCRWPPIGSEAAGLQEVALGVWVTQALEGCMLSVS